MNPEGLRSTPRGLITPSAQSPQLDSQTTKIACQSPEMDYQTPNLGVKNRLPKAQMESYKPKIDSHRAKIRVPGQMYKIESQSPKSTPRTKNRFPEA